MVIGEEIYRQIAKYTPLRDDFLLFFDKITTTGVDFDVDLLINFFSQIHRYTHESEVSTTYDFQFDVYKFIILELFLSTIALFLKNGNYTLIEELLYSSYSTKTYQYDGKALTYKEFYNHVQYIDEYYKKLLNKDLISPFGTLLYERASSFITQNYLIEADFICYYVGELNNVNGHWYPVTYVYATKTSFNFFKQIKSKRYFEKVKGIYGVTTPEDLIQKIITYTNIHPHDRIGYGSGISFDRMIDIEKIATER